MNDDVTLPLDDRQRDPARAPEARDAWGSFRLLERVGYGGFGEVYRAWDPNLEREVALKLLLPSRSGELQSDGEYKAMLREARALASVRHPNIVSVYGIDRHDGRVGFWMDFVKGKTLSVLLGAQGPFGYREAALIGLDVTRALSAVHRAGLLHRDIKAENVMREEGGRILLMDLGLSALQHGQTNSSGTPNYMAPEIWLGKPSTVETDIYAMGVLLYFLVTGEYPVRLGGLTTSEAAEAITHRRPLMDLRSDLPEPFLRTVSRAMESDPAKRYSSAGQLAAALSECLGTGAPVESAAPSTASAERPKRLVWAGVAVAAVVLMGGIAFKVPSVRQWLHLRPPAVASGISASTNDQYIKAQELLKKSYKDQNVADAVTIFNKILAENPKFALAEAGLGNAYLTQYRNSDRHDGKPLDLAKEATDKALGLQGDLAPALATRARIEAMTGQPDLARQDALQATLSDPRSPEAFAALAAAYDALGKQPDAIDAIQKAIDLDPDNSMLPVRLGNYFMAQGKLTDAAAQWQSAIQVDPQNVFAVFDLGVVNMRLNKLEDAKKDFQQALQLEPDADYYLALGSVYLLEGNYGSAIEMDKKAIEIDKSNREAWANLGSAYAWSGGKHEDTRAAYSKAIELAEAQRSKTPADPRLLADLADYYGSIGVAEKSIPLARKSLVLSPEDPSVLYSCGDAYELLGERSKAIPLIAKALAHGFRVNEFQRSPELAALRADPAFEIALKKAKEESSVDSTKKIN